MASNTLGRLFSVTTFGESHGLAMGCIVDGCPPGLSLCESDIQTELERRRPGSSPFVSQRRESDIVQILSGIHEGKTTGTAIGLLIANRDAKSKDYAELKTFLDRGMPITPIMLNMEFAIIEVGGVPLRVKPSLGLRREPLPKNICKRIITLLYKPALSKWAIF